MNTPLITPPRLPEGTPAVIALAGASTTAEAPAPLADLCELRFVLPAPLVGPVQDWATAHLGPDPLGPGTADEPGLVQTLYFDTADLAVYGHRPGYRKTRWRVRRTGDDPLVTLERRRRHALGVRCQRILVPEWDLQRLGDGRPNPDWAGEWFRAGLAHRGLAPTCRVAFRRLARAGHAEGAPVRLCLDQALRCAPATGYRLDEAEWRAFGESVLELRFAHALPRLFKDLLREFALMTRPRSKYRLAVEACGLGGRA